MELRQHNFLYLLLGLMFLLLAMPLFRDVSGAQYGVFSELAFSVFLIIGVWSLHGSRRDFVIAIILVAGLVAAYITRTQQTNNGG